MNKIEKLIKEFCPDGVEWKKLGEVCEILDNKRKPITKSKRIIGKYPYYGANGVQDYIDNYIFDGTFILMGEDGSVINKDNTPILHWINESKIWVNNHAHVLGELDKQYKLKYIYYYLSIVDVSSIVKGVPPKINQANMRNIKIPIPPIEIQEEIVKILDSYTEYITELQEKLKVELQARNKQYNYYRDMLLSEDYLNKISEKLENQKKYESSCIELEKIIKIKNGKDWKSLGKGNVPVYGSGGEMGIFVDKYSYNKPTVLIPRKGSIENIFYLEKPFWNVDTIFYTEINEEKILPKYFYYFMQNYNIADLSTNPTRPSITQSTLNKLKILLPPIKIQNKIVKILDRFQELLSDTKGLLPLEIEQRRKEYEYYREKLLTFDSKCGSLPACLPACLPYNKY